MARRSYTPNEKAKALELYAEQGPTAVQTQLGIPKGTVTRWAKETGVGTVSSERNAAGVAAAKLHWEQRRLTMAHDIGETAELALIVVQGKLLDGSAGAAKDAATCMGILIDKAQILTGGETGHQRHTVTRDVVLTEARERALHLVPAAS